MKITKVQTSSEQEYRIIRYYVNGCRAMNVVDVR